MSYTVKAGDTLSAIAKKYGTTVQAIAKANPIIKDVNKISIGWVLTIPTQPVAQATRDYSAIGKKVEACVKDIQNLKSFQELAKLL